VGVDAMKQLAALILLLVALAACAPSRSVRVEPVDAPPSARPVTRDQTPAQPPLGAREYRVASGDTLYGIAFRHGLDYRELAARNRIEPPYTIYPGQRLALGDRTAAAPARRKPGGSSSTSTGGGVIASTAKPGSQPPVPSASAPPSNTSAVSASPGAAPAASSAAPSAPSPPVPSTSTSTPSAPAPTVVAPSASTAVAPTPPAALPKGPVRWTWPASGQTVSTYLAGDPTRQGIGIAGSNGQAVNAAGDGVVVYSGAGLIGYGELVIIKHSDEWLSAYGHNRKRLVAEGQAVRAGEQIAEMGRSGASRDMLHFEIRRNGKPVDPLGLLPRR